MTNDYTPWPSSPYSGNWMLDELTHVTLSMDFLYLYCGYFFV